MIVSLVVARAENGVIGVENRLPWHLPADLKHFKATTMGKPIVMGRRTFESIGKPLPGRDNIVVSRAAAFAAPGCRVVHSFEEALQVAEESRAGEIMVIGGAMLYEHALPHADRIYLTLVHTRVEGDVFFPALEATVWREVSHEDHGPDARNPHAYSFLVYERAGRG